MYLLPVAALFASLGTSVPESTVHKVQADVWADNWFALYAGLEYIGTTRQQMGDGGSIAQFRNSSTNELLAVSGSDWRCLSIHRAPLNRTCSTSPNPE